MTLIPPYLVIREDISFWVETRLSSSVSATLQAFNEGCYSATFCYDSNSELWPIENAEFKISPSIIHRLLPWRQLPVQLTFGASKNVVVEEVAAKLEAILKSDSEFNAYLRGTPETHIERLNAARSASELIEVVKQIA